MKKRRILIIANLLVISMTAGIFSSVFADVTDIETYGASENYSEVIEGEVGEAPEEAPAASAEPEQSEAPEETPAASAEPEQSEVPAETPAASEAPVQAVAPLPTEAPEPSASPVLSESPAQSDNSEPGDESADAAAELFDDEESGADDGNFTDVSHMSDEDFFGVWDAENNEWEVEGKLNYDYSPDLAEVERLVKLNSYAQAKDALFTYYKNKNMSDIDFFSYLSWGENNLYMRDTYAFEESVITYTNITNTGEYREYNVDLLNIKTTSVFLISSLTKTNDMVCIASRESGLSPSLEIRMKGGEIRTLYPTKDTYIRAYDDTEDYSNENYGDSEELYVKDSYYQLANGTYKPYSSKTRRTYIAFDAQQIPQEEDIDHMYLKFYAKIVPEEGEATTTETNHELAVFDACIESWDEKPSENNQFDPMTWSNYIISHYSWNGLPGGFDWNEPDHVAVEFMNYNTRFYDVTSLTMAALQLDSDDYMEKAIATTLDFINDTNGEINTAGVPASRDIESANRMGSIPAIFYTFLKSDLFNSDAMTAILKWIWEDTTYLYNGAGILYQGATTLPTSNNYAQTNRGVWHSTGFEAICTYFPEFMDRDMWKPLADERLEAVSDVLLGEDGCYIESTFSYAGAMFEYYTKLNKIIRDAGDELPDWFPEKMKNYAHYIMNISYPSRTPPKFGEGVPSDTTSLLSNYLKTAEDDEIEYVVTDGEDGIEPADTSVYYDGLRLASCRTGWARDDSMLMMQAKNGGNHNHKDSLAILYYSGDRELIADTGMTSYSHAHPHFQWQRHTSRSHNTIEIDGVAQRGSDFFFDQASDVSLHNGQGELTLYPGELIDRINAWTDATQGFRHYRNVSYIKNQDFIIVSDMVHPEDGMEHTYTQNWHTDANEPSNPTIDNTTKIGRTNYDEGSNLIIAQANTDGLTLSLETGYSIDSPDPTQYFCYTQSGTGDIMYNTVLYPQKVGDDVELNVTNIDTGVDPAVASAMSIDLFKNDEDALNVIYYNSFEETPQQRTFGEYETNAANATIEQDMDEIPTVVSLYNGSSLMKSGEEIISSDKDLDNIEVLYDGTTMQITSEDEDIKEAKLIIKAANKTENVIINDEAVFFVYSDGKVYINAGEEVDMTLNSGYLFKIPAQKNDVTYTVTIDIPADSIVSGSIEYPTCTFENNIFKINFGSGTLSSCAKITVSGHTDAGVSEYVNGTSKRINTVIDTGSTLAEADERVSENSPALERAREDLIIWTKDIAEFRIGAVSSSGGNGGGNGGGGVSTGGGGVSIRPFPTGGTQATLPPMPTESPEATAEPGSGGHSFSDCIGHWAEDDINYMYENGYINGISDELFAPDVNITRAEFAAMAARILELEDSGYSGVFEDVSEDDWYASSVEAAYAAGIVAGDGGYFRPNDNITRQEMAVILMRICEPENGDLSEPSFADWGQVADWAKEAVTQAVSLGILKGMDDNTFAPGAYATRAQSASVFRRVIEQTGGGSER